MLLNLCRDLAYFLSAFTRVSRLPKQGRHFRFFFVGGGGEPERWFGEQSEPNQLRGEGGEFVSPLEKIF